MAITGPASYLPTCDEFLAHWAAANTAHGSAITLAGGTAIADLQTLRDSLAAARTNVTAKLNDREYARADITSGAEGLVARLEQFCSAVRALYPNSRYINALPKVPDARAGMDKIVTPLDDANSIWKKIDSAEAPLILGGGYDWDIFDDSLSQLKTAYTTYNAAVVDLKIARGERNELQGKIYPMLKQYRQIIPAFFVEGSAIFDTLPRLTPKPGSTPEPVNASAVWDDAEAKAKIVFDASDNAHLKEYQVRFTPGDEYDPEDESIVAHIQPDDPRELLTDAGLTQPGAAATFKVYVVLTTGNEAGSEAMTVERPQS